jgi:hypothetical protein
MDRAIDDPDAGAIDRFELTADEWTEFLFLHKQGNKLISNFKPMPTLEQPNPPGYTYRGIGVIMV